MRTALLALCALALSACDPTSGREVPFHMHVTSVGEGDAPPGSFVTTSGWLVSLSEASIVLGPVYLYENPPPAAWRWEELFIRRAWAHPGDQHFNGGQVWGEFVDQVAFDALSTAPRDLGELTGTAAKVRSFSLLLDPPRQALRNKADPTQGHVAWVVGEAVKGDARVAFEGGLDLPQAGTLRRVDGLPVEADLDAGGTFTLEVHPASWFRDADFAQLTATAPSGRRLITDDSQVRAVWFIGARSSTAFSARWDPAR